MQRNRNRAAMQRKVQHCFREQKKTTQVSDVVTNVLRTYPKRRLYLLPKGEVRIAGPLSKLPTHDSRVYNIDIHTCTTSICSKRAQLVDYIMRPDSQFSTCNASDRLRFYVA